MFIRWPVPDARFLVHAFVGIILLTACSGNAEVVERTVPVDPPPEGIACLFVVEDPANLNVSDALIRERLRSLGLSVTLQDATNLTTNEADGYDLVVQSKTPDAATVGTKLKRSTTPLLTGEDNAQMLTQLAFIDDRGTTGTAWHHMATELHLASDAPEALRAGLSGRVIIYPRADDISFSPHDDAGHGTLMSDAIRVAEFGSAGSELWAMYAAEEGARLADGTRASARRVFYGALYDDTFRHLTDEGLALFDASVRWLIE